MAPRPPEPIVAVVEDLPIPSAPNAIDALLRQTVRRLAERDLEIGRLARRLVSGHGWRRLGYASRDRYAIDRVGMSRSSLEHRVTLARRAAASPELEKALLAGAIGYEAAMQIARIEGAGPKVVAAWVRRAKRRTVLALRDEVNAVLLETSLNPGASKEPPDAAALEEIEALEAKVTSGELFRSLLDGKLDPQMSVTLPAGTGCAIHLTVPAELRAHFDRVEALFRRIAGPKASFVAFMCFCFWRSWLPCFEHAEDERSGPRSTNATATAAPTRSATAPTSRRTTSTSAATAAATNWRTWRRCARGATSKASTRAGSPPTRRLRTCGGRSAGSRSWRSTDATWWRADDPS